MAARSPTVVLKPHGGIVEPVSFWVTKAARLVDRYLGSLLEDYC